MESCSVQQGDDEMQSADLLARLGGVTAVLVAPFSTGTGAFDTQTAERLSRRCDDAGIHALTALGNTGEVYQLTFEEKVAALRAVAAGRRRAALIAGLCGPLADLHRQAEIAAGLGYDAVMVHEPPDPGASDQGIRTFLLDVAARCPLPVVLYIRTPRLSHGSLAELAAHPRIVAVKYAIADVTAAASLLALDGLRERCAWVCGLAESMVPAFSALGMRGFTSGLANVRPDLALGIWEAVQARDWPQFEARLRRILPFELLRNRDGGRYNVAVVKTALAWQGIDVGEVRPPCAPLDVEGRAQLRRILESWDAEPCPTICSPD
jgi:4-hydroxy-tetrahydrodipicolinate synthase